MKKFNLFTLLILSIGCCKLSNGAESVSACETLTIVESEQLNWLNAKAACEKMGAKLLTLPSNDEIAALADQIGENKYYWVGGHCPGCANAAANGWKWITGETISKKSSLYTFVEKEDDGLVLALKKMEKGNIKL